MPEKGHLLEVGSYCGFFIESFKNKYPNWDYIGVEPSKWASEYARSHLKINTRTGTLEENIKELKPEYDAVVSWDVLEHLKDPIAFLSKQTQLRNKMEFFVFLHLILTIGSQN